MELTKRLSILYAEDNEDARFMLTTLLGFSGIGVLLVRNIREAFSAAQNRPFDLYLLNSKFSDGCGFDLCRELRRLKPYTPIVFYSGDAYETDKQKGLLAGANVYLIKPEVDTVIPTIFQLTSKVSKMH